MWLALYDAGADPGGGGAPGARPSKIGKNKKCWRKIVISLKDEWCVSENTYSDLRHVLFYYL
jgi:hypothetical protein